MIEKTSVIITAIWTRRIGDKVQTLVEIDGVWRLALEDFADNSYSHIAEGRGVTNWKEDSTINSDTVNCNS